MALKIGMKNLWADGGILPVSGVTELAVTNNRGRVVDRFLSVCLCGSFDG